MTCLISQQLILHLHLTYTCTALHPETCQKHGNQTWRKCHWGVFWLPGTISTTFQLDSNFKIYDLGMFCSRQNKEPSKAILSRVHHLPFYLISIVWANGINWRFCVDAKLYWIVQVHDYAAQKWTSCVSKPIKTGTLLILLHWLCLGKVPCVSDHDIHRGVWTSYHMEKREWRQELRQLSQSKLAQIIHSNTFSPRLALHKWLPETKTLLYLLVFV